MSNETEYPAAIDVVGYNYTENRYEQDHATYPKRVIYGSENGTGIDAWYAVRNNDFIFGQFLWTGVDNLGESGGWPNRGSSAGMLDLASVTKPRGYFRASLWLDTPTTYIGTYVNRPNTNPRFAGRNFLSTDAPDVWNYDNGQTIRVVCYTNSPQARLLLNGRVVGQLKPYDEKTGVIYWDIPYQAGELKAEGCDADGKVQSDYVIRSSGLPYALRARLDKTAVSADRGMAHLFIEVVDDKGVAVKLADNDITCRIEGPAQLLGLENGDMTDTGIKTDPRQRAYRGNLLGYIRTTGEKGAVNITLTSPLLQSAQVTLTAE
jgi:hypothetical protein